MNQWHKLIGTASDAQARTQLGEDSFYLALDATTRGEFNRAQKFLDDANTFAPNGAGPLYTPERLQNQIKLTHIAAARADIENGAISNALVHVRAAYGNQFQPATNLPTDALALNRARIKTTRNERELTLQLVPYPAPSGATLEIANQVVTKLNDTGAGTAELAADAIGYTITIQVPFNGDNDLRNRLVQLASAIPARSDWALVRAALVPALLEIQMGDDLFSRRVKYREEVDLAPGQEAMQSTLNEMSATIGTLSAASPDNQESQLKLALVTHAQKWWHKQLSALTLDYDVDLGGGVTRQWTVSPGTPRTLEFETDAMRGETYILGGIAVIGFIAALVVAAGLVLSRRRR
jgi:hypothetical protein